MNAYRAAELLVQVGRERDFATLVREPRPQPMVKDAVVFAPTPDKQSVMADAIRRLVAERPIVGEQSQA